MKIHCPRQGMRSYDRKPGRYPAAWLEEAFLTEFFVVPHPKTGAKHRDSGRDSPDDSATKCTLVAGENKGDFSTWLTNYNCVNCP